MKSCKKDWKEADYGRWPTSIANEGVFRREEKKKKTDTLLGVYLFIATLLIMYITCSIEMVKLFGMNSAHLRRFND